MYIFFFIIIAAKLYNSISLHRNYLLRGKLKVTWNSPGFILTKRDLETTLKKKDGKIIPLIVNKTYFLTK